MTLTIKNRKKLLSPPSPPPTVTVILVFLPLLPHPFPFPFYFFTSFLFNSVSFLFSFFFSTKHYINISDKQKTTKQITKKYINSIIFF